MVAECHVSARHAVERHLRETAAIWFDSATEALERNRDPVEYALSMARGFEMLSQLDRLRAATSELDGPDLP